MTQHILIVDDDIDFAESVMDLLEERHYRVTVVLSGEEALQRVLDTPFDLVLLDMKMPGMNGVECLEQIRRIRPGTPVVMVTAFTKLELIRQALEQGAMAVLHKPVPVEELLETIAFLATGGAVLLVEDDADLSAELSEVLHNAGYAVRNAASCKEAQEVLTRHGSDLILLDFRLPDGTGADLLAWLHGAHRRESVVLMTGYPDAALAALPCIFPRDMLVKPFRTEALLSIVSRTTAP